MPFRHPQDGPDDAPSFWEAIAQWQLSLRTEVKSTSSLPSAVFHACDATLEAQLAQSTEGMLARLLEPPPEIVQAHPDGERRIEVVSTEELRALLRRLGGAEDTRADLDDHLLAESLSVLTDATCTGPEPAAVAAAATLRRHFGIAPGDDPLAVAAQLTQLLDEGGTDAEAVAALCQRIVAILTMHSRVPPPPGGRP